MGLPKELPKKNPISRRDFLKLGAAALGGVVLIACDPLKDFTPVVKELPQSPETKNMSLMMREISQLFPKYNPKLTYLKAGELGDDGRKQVDRHYIIFSSMKTSDELKAHSQFFQDLEKEPLLTTLVDAFSFSAAQVKETPGGQAFVPPVTTTEAIRRIREDHEKDQDLEPPNYKDATDFVGVAVKTADGEVYLFEAHKSGWGLPSLIPLADIVKEKNNLTDEGVVTIDASKRMEPLTGRPFPTE